MQMPSHICPLKMSKRFLLDVELAAVVNVETGQSGLIEEDATVEGVVDIGGCGVGMGGVDR